MFSSLNSLKNGNLTVIFYIFKLYVLLMIVNSNSKILHEKYLLLLYFEEVNGNAVETMVTWYSIWQRGIVSGNSIWQRSGNNGHVN